MIMNIETVKSAMIEQYKEMCEEFSKTPRIKEPIFTYLGPIWNPNQIANRRFAAGQCAGALRLLKEVLTEDEYTQLINTVDKWVEADVSQNEETDP